MLVIANTSEAFAEDPESSVAAAGAATISSESSRAITLIFGFSVLDAAPLLEERNTPLLGVEALITGAGALYFVPPGDFSLIDVITFNRRGEKEEW